MKYSRELFWIVVVIVLLILWLVFVVPSTLPLVLHSF